MKSLFVVPLIARQAIFLICILACIFFPVDPPIALAAGLAIAFTIGNPFIAHNSKATHWLLQLSVVCLGFHINLIHAMETGKTGFVFTVCSIGITLGAGYLLGKKLLIDKKTSYLISNGTAICGGSAIAAIAPLINANEEQMSMSLGTVFILNSIALFIFPFIGHLAGFDQRQFGTWCAIAIHDTSSVVGAASKYGQDALQVATTIKLERALWIIPISLLTAWLQKNSGQKIKIPYFIFLFIIAMVISTYLPGGRPVYDVAYTIGKKGLVVVLFLIGSGLSLGTIRNVGWRPVLQGVLLWILISVSSFVAIKHFI